MNAATYRGFTDEMKKIAAFISGVTAARPILKQFHPGAHGFETLAKGVGDTAVIRRGAQAAGALPGLVSKTMGALKGLKPGRAAAAGAAGLAGGAVAEHKLHKNKQDQAGYAIPG
jgi:hypothetical protein